MLDFLDRDAFEIIFSSEVIFCAVFTISLFILVHSVLSFLRHSGPLYKRMNELEAEISVLAAGIPVRIEEIAQRRRELSPLQDDFKQLRDYHARLSYMAQKAMEEEEDKEKEEDDEGQRSIRRQRLGLDRFI